MPEDGGAAERARKTRTRLMFGLCVLAACGFGALSASGRLSPPARVIEQRAVPELRRVSFTFSTDRECSAGVVLWPAADHTAKRHVRSDRAGSQHALAVDGLEPGTRYTYAMEIEHRSGTCWTPMREVVTQPPPAIR